MTTTWEIGGTIASIALFAALSANALAQGTDESIGSLPAPLAAGAGGGSEAEDSDQDGLSDAEEDYWLTNRFDPDSDGDGLPDGLEIRLGTNPHLPTPNQRVAAFPGFYELLVFNPLNEDVFLLGYFADETDPFTSTANDAQQPLSDLYRPLPPLPPPTLTPGMLCVKSIRIVGVIGCTLISEVLDAYCEPADGFCSSSCVDSIGTQTELIDPLCLVGG